MHIFILMLRCHLFFSQSTKNARCSTVLAACKRLHLSLTVDIMNNASQNDTFIRSVESTWGHVLSTLESGQQGVQGWSNCKCPPANFMHYLISIVLILLLSWYWYCICHNRNCCVLKFLLCLHFSAVHQFGGSTASGSGGSRSTGLAQGTYTTKGVVPR